MDSPPPLPSSGLRAERTSLPAALRPYVREVFEEAIPALAEALRRRLTVRRPTCAS